MSKQNKNKKTWQDAVKEDGKLPGKIYSGVGKNMRFYDGNSKFTSNDGNRIYNYEREYLNNRGLNTQRPGDRSATEMKPIRVKTVTPTDDILSSIKQIGVLEKIESRDANVQNDNDIIRSLSRKSILGATPPVRDDSSDESSYGRSSVTIEPEMKASDFINKDAISASMERRGLDKDYIDVFSPAIEKLAFEDLYPSASRDVQAGTYQGSIVGSVPIFSGAGGLAPAAIYQARERATEAAIKARELQIDKIVNMEQIIGSPIYQHRIDELQQAVVNKWAEKYNWDIEALTKDTKSYWQFNQELYKVKAFANETSRIDGLVSGINEDAIANQRSIPASTLKAMEDWQNAYLDGDILDMYEDKKKWSKYVESIKSYSNLITHLKDAEVIKNITASKSVIMSDAVNSPEFAKRSAQLISQGVDYDVWSTTMFAYVEDEYLKRIASGIKNGGTFMESEEEIIGVLRGFVGGGQAEVKTSIASKWNPARKSDGGGGGGNDPKGQLGLISSIGAKVWDYKSGTQNQGFVDAVDSIDDLIAQAKSANPNMTQEQAIEVGVNKFFTNLLGGITTEPTREGREYVMAKIPHDPTTTKLETIASGSAGYKIYFSNGFEDAAKFNGQYLDPSDWMSAIETSLSSVSSDFKKYMLASAEEKDALLRDVNDINDAKTKAQLEEYKALMTGPQNLISQAIPSSHTVELQRMNPDGTMSVVKKSQLANNEIPASNMTITSSITYKPMKTDADGNLIPDNLSSPVMIMYNLKSETDAAVLDRAFSGSSSQKRQNKKAVGEDDSEDGVVVFDEE